MAFDKPVSRKKQKKDNKKKGNKNDDKGKDVKNKVLMVLLGISLISFCIFLYCFYYLFKMIRALTAQMEMEQANPVKSVFEYILNQRTDLRNGKNALNYLNLLQNFTRNASLKHDIIDYSLNSSIFTYFYDEIQKHSQKCVYLEDQNAISNILETLLSLFTLNEPRMVKCDAVQYFQLLGSCYRSPRIINLVFDCLISHIKLGCEDIPQILIQKIQEKDILELRTESLNFFSTFIKSQIYDSKYNQTICNYIESLAEYAEDMPDNDKAKLSKLSQWCSRSKDL